MTTRRTVPAHGGAAQQPPAEPASGPVGQPLHQWALAQAVDLAQGIRIDSAEVERGRERTLVRWRLGTQPTFDQPVVSSERSESRKTYSATKKASFWIKRFLAERDIALRLNETRLLIHFSQVEPPGKLNLRQFVGWTAGIFSQGSGSRLDTIETLDGGPNLDDWQAFAPCRPASGLAGSSAALPTPLFVQPDFLAAIVRRTLIALGLFHQVGVLHNDIKPDNLCLALPADWQVGETTAHGSWDLRDLPLRVIDWETGFLPNYPRLNFAGASNTRLPWTSPFAFACHGFAQGLAPAAQAACLEAIDWGADLWSLGHMLDGWCDKAIVHLIAFQATARQEFGLGSAELDAVESSYLPLMTDIGWLRGFAVRLQAYERPAAEADVFRALLAQPAAGPDPYRLTVRDKPPHLALQLELEQRFPVLGSASRGSECQFVLLHPMAGPDPQAGLRQPTTEPVAPVAPAPAPVPILATVAPAPVKSAVPVPVPVPAKVRPTKPPAQWHSFKVVFAFALLVSVVLRMSYPFELAMVLPRSTAWLAQALLRVSLNPAWPHDALAALARPPRQLHDTLEPGQGDVLALQTLVAAEADNRAPLDPGPDGTLHPGTLSPLARQREADLRSLRVLASLADATLASAPAKDLSGRLLVRVGEAGNLLERAAGKPVPVDSPAQALNALARLQATQGWPMAAWLLVHYHACYAPDAGAQHLQAALALLQAVPAPAQGGDFYPAWGREWQGRLQRQRPMCHFND